jgi:hypothetical protein
LKGCEEKDKNLSFGMIGKLECCALVVVFGVEGTRNGGGIFAEFLKWNQRDWSDPTCM